MLMYVYTIVIADKYGEKGIRNAAGNVEALITGLVLTLISTAYVIRANQNQNLSALMGYLCLILQTIGLLLVTGFIVAVVKIFATKVLSALVAALVVLIVFTISGERLLDMTNMTNKQRMNTSFIVLSLLLTTFMVTMLCIDRLNLKHTIIMFFILCISTIVLVFDTHYIV